MRFISHISLSFLKPINLLFYLIFSYLIYHLFFGSKGLIAYYDLKNQHNIKQSEYSNLQLKQEQMEWSVKLLEPQNESMDMLEEKIKEQFSFAKEEELLIIMQNPYEDEASQ